MHCLLHDVFTDFSITLNLSATLGIPWRGSDVLKVPVEGYSGPLSVMTILLKFHAS